MRKKTKRKTFQLLLLGANIFSRIRLPLPWCVVYSKLLLLLVIAFLFNFIRMSTGWNQTKCLQPSTIFFLLLFFFFSSEHIFLFNSFDLNVHTLCAHPKYLVCHSYFRATVFAVRSSSLIWKVQNVYFFLIRWKKQLKRRKKNCTAKHVWKTRTSV